MTCKTRQMTNLIYWEKGGVLHCITAILKYLAPPPSPFVTAFCGFLTKLICHVISVMWVASKLYYREFLAWKSFAILTEGSPDIKPLLGITQLAAWVCCCLLHSPINPGEDFNHRFLTLFSITWQRRSGGRPWREPPLPRAWRISYRCRLGDLDQSPKRCTLLHVSWLPRR